MSFVYTKIDVIERKIVTESYVYYRVTDIGDKQTLDENDTIADPEQAFEALTQTLNDLDGKAVRITLNKYNKAEKASGGTAARSQLTYYYQLNDSSNNRNNPINGYNQPANSNQISIDNYLKLMSENSQLKIDLAIEKLTTDYQNKKRELEREPEPVGAFDTVVIEGLKELLAGLKSGAILGGVKPIANVERPTPTPQKEPVSEQTKEQIGNEIGSLLVRLQEQDPDFINTLRHVVALSEQQPDVYNSVVGQLKATG